MIKTSIEFAQGTTDHSKKVVQAMFQKPSELLGAYREARDKSGQDIVMCVSLRDPSAVTAGSRLEYCQHLRRLFGRRASEFGVWHKSAHAVANLPLSSEAFWLIVDIPGQELPIMCVLFGVSYEQEKQGKELSSELS